MPEKELNYIRSNNLSSDDKSGGVIVDYFKKQDSKPKLTWLTAFKDSFKGFDADEACLDHNLTEVHKIAVMMANSPLSISLKNRNLQMIAIGGSIGTGLFIGSEKVLKHDGPAAAVLRYVLIGLMSFCTVHLGELEVTFPLSVAVVTYTIRFIYPSWSSSMTWNYSLSWLIVFPLELVAVAITTRYWNTSISAARVSLFYVLIVIFNFFGVRGYGEAELIFSFIKLVAVIVFIFLGIILICGGDLLAVTLAVNIDTTRALFPWVQRGLFCVCSVFVTAAFAFAGSELVSLAAAESQNPRKAMPKAIKQVFWRIRLFYVI